MKLTIRLLLVVLPLASGATALSAPPNAAELAARIDRLVVQRCEQAGLEPAPPATDAEFLRRVCLDLIGRIPTVSETRAFLADASGDKRDRIVQRLLHSAAYPPHLATFWQRAWMPQLDTPPFASLVDDAHEWLTLRLRDNVPYNQIVHELLTVELSKSATSAGADGLAAPRAFMAVGEFKPELLAANTARAFLGVNLDCAQCHDHPFARWTREQFWQTAAFFVRPVALDEATSARLQLTIPDTEVTVTPRLLIAADLSWPEQLDSYSGRRALADWLSSEQNPYLARNAANRLWALFFGTGLVEPLDDLSQDNPPSHPELLDVLAAALVDSNYDLRFLVEAIARSRTYQRSSAGGSATSSDGDQPFFARMAVRGLTGEQLYDSLHVAAGAPIDHGGVAVRDADEARRQFALAFHSPRPATAERSIVQALALMNGPLTSGLTKSDTNSTLSAVAGAPFLDVRGKIDTLVLATLSREPTEAEIESLADYVERRAPDHGLRNALGDVFWALLNSSEFNTNH